jgi:hypothetical protein
MSLNRTALEASVAEKSFTGIETSPKLSDSEAMARGIVDIPEKLAGADVGLGVAGGFFVAFAA